MEMRKIVIDFVIGLPQTLVGHDAIWVVLDRLTKSTHFLPIRTNCPLEKLANLYIQEIVRLHGVPSNIVSNRKITSRFWGVL